MSTLAAQRASQIKAYPGAGKRIKAPPPQASRAQLAAVRRHIETIILAKHPQTGAIVEKGKKVGALIDKINEEGVLAFELFRAVEYYRELLLVAEGKSQGVAGYGDHVRGSEASRRMITSEIQMAAREEFLQATLAVFGTPRQDGDYAIDEQLVNLSFEAFFKSCNKITKGSIGARRSNYKNGDHNRATGVAILVEICHRLCLHLCFSEGRE
jgi:hypothetical protein